MVLDMRGMIKGLQEDCRSLAAAITQMSTGADMSSVLQTLPPTLVQVGLQISWQESRCIASAEHAVCRGAVAARSTAVYRNLTPCRKTSAT